MGISRLNAAGVRNNGLFSSEFSTGPEHSRLNTIKSDGLFHELWESNKANVPPPLQKQISLHSIQLPSKSFHPPSPTLKYGMEWITSFSPMPHPDSWI